MPKHTICCQLIIIVFYFIQLGKPVKNKFLFTMTAYQGTVGCSEAKQQIFTMSAWGFNPATFLLLT
jgi:hypothetical protein